MKHVLRLTCPPYLSLAFALASNGLLCSLLAGGLTDIRRLAELLGRIQGKIRHRDLKKVSPLAVPVLLEIGKTQVYGGALEELLDESAQALIAEATEDLEQAELPL